MKDPLRIQLATGNTHKVREVARALQALLPGPAAVSLEAYSGPAPAEDGDSFRANALLKARAAHRQTGLPTLADDSGICVTALNGMPGIFSARWAGAAAADHRNLLLLQEQLADFPANSPGRRSRFVCVLALVGRETELTFTGVWEGRLLPEPRGELGFGYDPLFQPEGYSCSAAELPAEVKTLISHRGRALTLLAAHVRNLSNSTSGL